MTVYDMRYVLKINILPSWMCKHYLYKTRSSFGGHFKAGLIKQSVGCKGVIFSLILP